VVVLPGSGAPPIPAFAVAPPPPVNRRVALKSAHGRFLCANGGYGVDWDREKVARPVSASNKEVIVHKSYRLPSGRR
jgi:hypothetical protein